MLIWDTGEYSVHPYRASPAGSGSENEAEDNSEVDSSVESSEAGKTDSQMLHEAFQFGKIRLQLHGRRLPPGYTIALRMTKENFRFEQPRMPTRRRRKSALYARRQKTLELTDSDSSGRRPTGGRRAVVSSLHRVASPPKGRKSKAGNTHFSSDDEPRMVQENNAYLGATNSIHSVYQRKWFLSLDREASGFVRRRHHTTEAKYWVRGRGTGQKKDGFARFWVLGRDAERSVVTGRLAKDILQDEGVEGFVPRRHWRPVTE